MVAGTVISIINTVDGTTRTSTILNELPSGYTFPITNAAGTHIETVTFESGGVNSATVLAFPTSVFEWPSEYIWSGTLLTTDSGGTTSCVTVSEDYTTVLLTSEPPQQPLPTITPSPSDGMADPEGLQFTVTSNLFPGKYLSSYITDPAIQNCGAVTLMASPVPALTVRFQLQTSTSYENVSTKSTSQSSQTSTSTPEVGSSGMSTPLTTPGSTTTLSEPAPPAGSSGVASGGTASSGEAGTTSQGSASTAAGGGGSSIAAGLMDSTPFINVTPFLFALCSLIFAAL